MQFFYYLKHDMYASVKKCVHVCIYVHVDLHAGILYNMHQMLYGSTKILLLNLWIKAMVTVLNLIFIILLMVFWSLWYLLHLIQS